MVCTCRYSRRPYDFACDEEHRMTLIFALNSIIGLTGVSAAASVSLQGILHASINSMICNAQQVTRGTATCTRQNRALAPSRVHAKSLQRAVSATSQRPRYATAPVVVSAATAAGAPRTAGRPLIVCQAAVSALDRVSEPHLQLATARLPPNADPNIFAQAMYQWAATLTQSGANLPFVYPLRADKLPTGFQISMLRRSDKTKSFGSAGDLVATVEQQDGVGAVFMVRFYEGEVAQDNKAAGWVPPSDPIERLEVALAGCKDVDTVMANMPQAIRIAAKTSCGP